MSFADDKITRAKILELDGYEHLVKIAQGELPHGPFQELLDIRIEKVERGELTLKSRPTSRFYNPYGVAHGEGMRPPYWTRPWAVPFKQFAP